MAQLANRPVGLMFLVLALADKQPVASASLAGRAQAAIVVVVVARQTRAPLPSIAQLRCPKPSFRSLCLGALALPIDWARKWRK